MKPIDIIGIINSRIPSFMQKSPSFLRNTVLKSIVLIMCEKRFNGFLCSYTDPEGIDFIDSLFEYLDFSYIVSGKDREKIPCEGRLICVANHPLGALDALAVIKAIHEVRQDVRIIANDLLTDIEGIREFLLPLNIYSKETVKDRLLAIGNALEREEAVIIFPSAEVSRTRWGVIADPPWHKGAIYLAKKYHAPVLPVFIRARNTSLFYVASLLSRKLSALLLPSEILKKKSASIHLLIGSHIPAYAFFNSFLKDREMIKLLRKHVYNLAKNKKEIFKTEKNVIRPVDKKELKKELSRTVVLGKASGSKLILLAEGNEIPNTLREISRLRELTFRTIGEGTGRRMDTDKHDPDYKHIILWDEETLEIIGSYRIAICSEIISRTNRNNLYTSGLFGFSEKFCDEILNTSMELGRSFIQKKYWNTPSLDYLWQGIGAFLAYNPNIKYMFGAVSISNRFTEETKNYIVYFFNYYFGSNDFPVIPANPFMLSEKALEECRTLFTGKSYDENLRILKNTLRLYNISIPPLYKHYTDLCMKGGTRFLGFSVDTAFGNCIDGLILLDIDMIKEGKRKRYIEKFRKQWEEQHVCAANFY